MKNWQHFLMIGGIGSMAAIGGQLEAWADQDPTNTVNLDRPHDDTRTDQEAPHPVSLYHAHEFSVDAFGTVSLGQQGLNNFSGKTVVDSGQLGAGVGLNYFFTRFLGLGVDAYSANTTGVFVDNLSANLIGRLPLGHTGLAPYIMGGGGYQFEVKDWLAQAGGGIEYRFMRHAGVFADARYEFTNRAPNFGLFRFGLRFSF